MRENNQENFIYGETWSAEAPAPTAEAYKILAEHLSEGGNSEESHLVLNDIYKALADSEPDVVLALNRLEQKGDVNAEEILVLTVLLAVSRTLGPDLDFLREAIVRGNFNSGEMDAALLRTGLDKRITGHIREVVAKLNV